MKQVLPLSGGIDKDTSPLLVKSDEGVVLNRENCRTSSLEGNSVGITSTIKGMEYINPAYPSGTNKAIGYIEDKERERGVCFVYNSLGNHGIYLLQGSGMSSLNAVSSALNFHEDESIDGDILGDYCVFVSDYNPPRKIDVTESLSGLDENDIQLAVQPPSSKPSVILGSDTTKKINKLIGKTFQFATMFIYKDYTYSVLSPYSDLVVTRTMFSTTDDTYEDNSIDNYVNVTYDLGSAQVATVRLLAREGNSSNWFLVEEYDKTEETGTRTVSFANDVAREYLSETTALNIYSDVPRYAKTAKAVQNVIALGNVTKGYDKEDENGDLVSVDYGLSYDTADLGGSIEYIPLAENGEDDTYYVEFSLNLQAGSWGLGDSLSISIDGDFYNTVNGDKFDFKWSYDAGFVVTQADVDTGDARNALADKVVTDLNNRGIDDIIDDTSYKDNYKLEFLAVNRGSGVVRLEFIGAYDHNDPYDTTLDSTIYRLEATTGAATHKAGSYKNVGIVFYDEYSRTSGVLNPQKVYVPHAGERDYENAYDIARITFSISDPSFGVPSWARYCRFAVTESINFSGVYPFVVGNDSGENIYATFLDGNSVIAINMPTNLSYTFTSGDYLQLEVNEGTSISTIVKTIIGTRTIIEVEDEEKSGFWLIIPAGTQSVDDYDGALVSIYRPKAEVEDMVYFEASDTYNVIDGVIQTTSGTLGGEDAWYLKRSFEWSDGDDGKFTTVATVEDFYINVDSAIRAFSQGRALAEIDDTLGELQLQDFVWSLAYLDNTKINGISMFTSSNRVQLDEKDGEIQKIMIVGDVAKVIQPNKETSLYVGKEQISNADGALSTVKTEDFIGTVYPSANDYGSRFPESICKKDRNAYYWDGDRGVVIRSAPNGQTPISSYGMKSEFLRLKKLIDNATDARVISAYDSKNDELIVTFDIDGYVKTWVFREGDNAWIYSPDYTKSGAAPELYGNINNQMYAFLGGAWKFEANSSHNTFFGEFKPLLIEASINTYPREEKCLKAIETASNQALKTTITSPVTNTHPYGQKTYLYSETYKIRDGKFTSAVFKDIIGAGGSEVMSKIHSGDDMVGEYFRVIFTGEEQSEYEIRMATATYSVNR